MSDEYDGMTTEDLFTSDELAAMDLGDELRMDEAAAARYDNPEPSDGLISGIRQCDYGDYHDPHEWHTAPHLWCPGHSTEPATEPDED